MLQCLINQVRYIFKTKLCWDDFPDSPVVDTLPSNTGDGGSVPGWAAKTSKHMNEREAIL